MLQRHTRLLVILLIGLELLLPALSFAQAGAAAADRWHTWTAANGLAGNIVQAIWADPDGRMWFGTENGASRYDGVALETYRSDGASLIDNNVWSISGDAAAVWFATSNGVSELRDGRWRSYSSADGLPHNDVRTILAGRDGSVWVGTFGGGIGRRPPGQQRWETVDISSAVGDPHVIVQASWQAADGAIWFGTNGAGVLRISAQGLERFSFKNEYQNIVWSIGSAAGAGVWAGTFRGVVRIDASGEAESVASAGAGIDLAETEVLAVAVRDAGSIWLGTRAHGVLHRTARGWERFSVADGLGRNYVQTILVDGLGRVWFGTRGGGVSLLDQRALPAASLGAGVAARDVLTDTAIALDGAALSYDQNNLQFTFTAAAPWLPAQDIGFHYWITGPGGALADEILRGGPAAEVRLSTPPLIDLAPGAYVLHVAPLIAGVAGREASYAFSIRSAPPSWGAAALSVSADGAAVTGGATLGPVLWGSEREVTLSFAASDDNQPASPLRYEYRSAGQIEWLPASGPSASLRLPAGQHRIEVQAIDADGNRSAPAAVTVVVPGPLWRMILAYLGIVLTPGLLGAGLGAWGYRRWSRRLALRRAVRGHVIPYDVGPLISAPERYIGRQHVLDSVLGRIDHNSFYIYGEKRIGKTSLLAQIRQRLQQRNAMQAERLYVPVFRNIQDVPQEQFWQVLIRSIADAIAAPALRLAAAGPAGSGVYDDFDAQDDLLALLAGLEDGIRPRRPLLVLLLDEIDTFQRYDPLVRQRFRAFCQHMQEHMQVVLVGVLPPRAEAHDTSPWYNIFAPLALEPLDPAAALDLIRNYNHNPYPYEPAAEQALLSAGDRKPFDTQWLCAESVRAMLAAGRSRVLAADVTAGIAAVVAERRREYAAFWQQLGPAARAELERTLAAGGALPPDRVAQGGYDRLFEAGLAINAGPRARLTELFQRWLRTQQC